MRVSKDISLWLTLVYQAKREVTGADVLVIED
jgi:hypothetical protein